MTATLLKEMRELIEVLKARSRRKKRGRGQVDLVRQRPAGRARGSMTTRLLHRATSPGSMAPASQTRALATAQPIAWRNSGSGSSRSASRRPGRPGASRPSRSG